ncbi:hypothetical protein CK510_05295 [Brunnivagina elsteri CCALA 953]|uniref:Uncharacterized protein n=1 Tax=Brunnivagina elsteri CCALA 953 TaxID=987040 RepID=A0A2A2TMU3_9CYAN|nr:hypothetical protein CK510_05295 [Calothrix elsteri CCALA 953]
MKEDKKLPYKTFTFEFVEGLPENHGNYLFLLEDGSIKEGYYSSFPYPHNYEDIRIADEEYEHFYYCNVVGWLKRLE